MGLGFRVHGFRVWDLRQLLTQKGQGLEFGSSLEGFCNNKT